MAGVRVAVLSACQYEGRSLSQAILSLLGTEASQVALTEIPPEHVSSHLEALRKAEVVIADPPLIAPFLDHLESVKWVQSTWAGVNHIVNSPCTNRNFTLTRLAGYLGPCMAEYVIGQIISIERLFPSYLQLQAQAEWPKQKPLYRPLSQLTLGILGATGDIGGCIAAGAKAFGMRTCGFARKEREDKVPNVDRMFYGKEALPQFLSGADYLVSILPSTKETKGLLNGTVLQACKGAVLINVGRGDVIDEETVIHALDQKWIRQAVLDVFVPEPLPTTSKLWSRKDIIVTPHISAMTFPEHVVDSATKNLRFYLERKPLLHPVSFDVGY